MDYTDPLALLTGGRFTDPETRETVTLDTRDIRIEESLDGMESVLTAKLELGDRLAVVSDPATREVMGARVVRALASIARVQEINLGNHPHADMETVAEVRDAAAGSDAIVAVGSGTINDLCKYASAMLEIPYLVFGTAPSMNGYLSANAAITQHGHKKSLPAKVPVATFFDLRVLSKAPVRTIRSGLGDSLCRSTAQSDWLLAHFLLDQPYRRVPFDLLSVDEERLFAEPQALIRGDIPAMRSLVRTLVLSGLGMTLCGSSHPASQGEHLISHYIDMMAPAERLEYFHGEQVGVSTLTMAALQQQLIDEPAPQIGASPGTSAEIEGHFGFETGADCWSEFSKKRIDVEQVDEFNHKLASRWDDVCAAIGDVARPPGTLRRVLESVGAPTSPEAIGVSRSFYRDAVLHARELRNRYTFLDLAGDARLLSGFTRSGVSA